VCVRVCVCACVRARARASTREKMCVRVRAVLAYGCTSACESVCARVECVLTGKSAIERNLLNTLKICPS
jgi:hypothetical protein